MTHDPKIYHEAKEYLDNQLKLAVAGYTEAYEPRKDLYGKELIVLSFFAQLLTKYEIDNGVSDERN